MRLRNSEIGLKVEIATEPNFLVSSSIFSYNLINECESDFMTDQILTLQEVAEYLKLAEKTAYRLAAEGKLPGFKVGGAWRFKREDLEDWIEEQKGKNEPETEN